MNIPNSAIVLAGGWEQDSQPPRLSMETRMRVRAFGLLAVQGTFENAVFSGGLQDPDGTTNEAHGMTEELSRQFPSLETSIIEDNECWDTWSSARNIADILAQYNIAGPHALITSRTHMPRSLRIFKTVGVEVQPLEAEDILLDLGTPEDGEAVKSYEHSFRRTKRVGLEAVMRVALKTIDKEGSFSKKLAHRTRNSSLPGKANG